MKQKFKKWKDMTFEEKQEWFKNLKKLQSTTDSTEKTKLGKQDDEFLGDPLLG